MVGVYTDASVPMRLVSAPLEVLAVQEEDGVPLHAITSAVNHPSLADDVAQPPLSASCYTEDALIVATTPFSQSFTLELRSFYLRSSDVNPAPHHILFPAPILPDLHMVASADGSIILQLCTLTGYAYRLHLPLQLLHSVDDIPSRWFVEQRLTAVSSDARSVLRDRSLTLTHCSSDAQVLLVACSDGRVAKLAWEQDDISQSSGALSGRWRESVLRPSTFFGRLFGLGASATSKSPSHVLSMMTFARSPSWTHTLGFTVSQDRRLRVWDLGSDACIRTLELPRSLTQSTSGAVSASEQELVLVDAQTHRNTSEDDTDGTLAPMGRNALIRPVVQAHQDASSPYALYFAVFVTATASSGSFIACYGVQLDAVSSSSSRQFSGSVGDIDLLWERRCDQDVSGSDVELRDMSITIGNDGQWDIWCVWDAAGRTLVKTTCVDVHTATMDVDAKGWRAVSLPASYTSLHGRHLDGELEALDDASELGPFFMQRITEPTRFSVSCLEDSIKEYEHVLLARKEDPVKIPSTAASQGNVREHILGLVGCTVELEQDEATGASMHDEYFAALKREWAIFVGLLFQHDTAERWPIAFIERSSANEASSQYNAPLIVSRGWLSLPVVEDSASKVLRIGVTASGGKEDDDGRDEDDDDSKAATFIQLADKLKHGIHARALREFESTLLDSLATQPSAVIEDVADDLWTDCLSNSFSVDKETLQEHFALMVGEDIRATMKYILSLLQGQTYTLGDDDEGQTTFTELAAALASDALTQTVSDRLVLARLLLLATLAANSGFLEHEQSFTDAGMTDLLRRSILAFHRLVAVDVAAHIDGVAEVTFSEPSLDEDAHDADTMARQMGQMRFGAGREATPTESNAAAVNLIHKGLLRGSLNSNNKATANYASWPVTIPRVAVNALSSVLSLDDDSSTAATLSPPAVNFANQALIQGHPSAAIAFVRLFPATPASEYIVARSLLALGESDEALESFEKVVRIFEHWDEERSSSLACGVFDILPLAIREAETSNEAAFLYYRHVVTHFRRARALPQIAHFASLAIARASVDDQAPLLLRTRELHLAVFRSCMEMEQYDDAYVHLLANPFDDLQRESLRTLISIMCERGLVETLLSYNFTGLQAEVERTLSFKARNSDPLGDGVNYYEILYAFHIRRGDLKSAGATMWQMGRRINDFYRRRVVQTRKAQAHAGIAAGYDAGEQVELQQYAIVEARCYLASVNVLSLIDSKDAWFAHEVSHGSDEEDVSLAYLKKMTTFVPATSFHKSTRDVCIVDLQDVRRRYQLLLAQLELVSLYPEEATAIMMSNTSDASSAVLLFVRNQDFERALTLALNAKVDRTQVYASLTDSCLALARWEEVRDAKRKERGYGEDEHPVMRALYDDEDVQTTNIELNGDDDDGNNDANATAPPARFLHNSDRCVAWRGSRSKRAWRYLRLWLSLEHDADASTTDGSNKDAAVRYHLAVLSRVLDRKLWRLVPAWLLSWLRENEADAMIRTLMEHDLLVPALEEAAALVFHCTAHVSTTIKRRRIGTSGGGGAGRTYMPYLLFDELLKRGEDSSVQTAVSSKGGDVAATSTLTERRHAAKALRDAIETHKDKLRTLETDLRRNMDEDEARQRRYAASHRGGRRGEDGDLEMGD